MSFETDVTRKPCPFCHSTKLRGKEEQRVYNAPPHHFIICMGCGAQGPDGATADAAELAWWSRKEETRDHELARTGNFRIEPISED
jgi:ribosomal protein L40E